MTRYYERINEQIKAAKNIVIVGGGPVGVEMAAEVKEHFPDKQVTIVTSKVRT